MREFQSFPVAIVGIGCRFPGDISSPYSFWEFLASGGDASREAPADRWDAAAFHDPASDRPGTIYTRRGSFLDNIDKFDPHFFGISPREASFMDPQQRLLLETTWEALEDAGQVPSRWAGRPVGVFVGLFTHDYENLRLSRSERGQTAPHSATGNSTTIAANRLSHAFDFTGPSMVIDTACSSSLVAVHQACRSLRAGESELALAGGVNIQILPEIVMSLSGANMLAPDGRCKSFDARANGYARADGVAMVALRPLADALADGDPIYGVIHGSAVNQDGRTPGITVPNGAAQKRAIFAALADAGLRPADISYIEAHGTGTPTGDPIEARALGEAIGSAQEPGRALTIGSVKSNFGHTESTAGVAGLIKAALMLHQGQIPPNRHFETPNPEIPFDDLRLRVPTAVEAWDVQRGRFAGVNSFGFGGTNAHVVLGEAPQPALPAACPTGAIVASGADAPTLICLSARSPESLRLQAQNHAGFLRSDAGRTTPLGDVAAVLALEREHHPHRLALAARSHEEVLAALDAHSAGERVGGPSTGLIMTTDGRCHAMVFSGMGQQWWNMGRSLRRSSAIFSDKLAEIDAHFAHHTGAWSLLAELDADEPTSRIDRTDIAQPAIFALQVALAELWRAVGVVPDLVVGHSVGEVAAAHVSGALSLEDAVMLSFHRSRLQATTAGQGGMLALGLSEDEAAERIAPYAQDICIAAVNSAHSVTLAGTEAVLRRLEPLFANEGVFARMLNVEVPYHSPAMEALRDPLCDALAGLRPRRCSIPMVSTVTGAEIDGSTLDAAYWYRNVRAPVLFGSAMATLVDAGCDTFTEIGAHPVLSAAIRECLAAEGSDGAAIASLNRKQDDTKAFLDATAQLYCRGLPIDFDALFRRPGRIAGMPRYAWTHASYWAESEFSRSQRTRRRNDGTRLHPLLGPRDEGGQMGWRNDLSPARPDYLRDHKVRDGVLFPAAAFIEMGLAASAQIGGDEARPEISKIRIERPLVLDEKLRAHVQTTTDSSGGFSIFGSLGEDDNRYWARHVSGKLASGSRVPAPPPARDWRAIRERLGAPLAKSEIYDRLARRGLQYGPQFRNLETAWCAEDEALGQITASPGIAGDLERYHLHPALLDTSFHLVALLPGEEAYLPAACERVTLFAPLGNETIVHVRLIARGQTRIMADIDLCSPDGAVLARVEGLTCRLFEGAEEADVERHRHFAQLWVAAPLPDAPEAFRSADFLPDVSELARRLHDEIDNCPKQTPHSDPCVRATDTLNALARAHCVAALTRLGCDWSAGRVSADALAETLGVAPRYAALLARLVRHLAAAGLIGQADGEFVLHGAPETDAPEAIFAAALRAHPDHHAELSLIRRAGLCLADWLRGEQDTMAQLVPAGSPLAEHLDTDSPTARPANRRMVEILRASVSAMPEGEVLRVLELGSGNGALTSWLLPVLPAGRSTYIATDPSGPLVERLAEQTRDWPFLQTQSFDIATDPPSGLLSEGGFDIIISADRLQPGAALSEQLPRIAGMLAPRGMLVFDAITCPDIWSELVYGPHRRHAALSEPDWRGLIADQRGFDAQVSIALSEQGGQALRHLFLARKAADPAARAAAEPAGVHSAHRVILLDDGSAMVQPLRAALRQRGCEVLVRDSESLADRAFPTGATVVDLRAISSATGPGCEPDIIPPLQAENACMTLREAVLALGDRDDNTALAYWVITQNTQALPTGDGTELGQAPLWGFVRSLANEESGLDLRLVDLGPDPDAAEVNQLAQLVLGPDAEDENALRGDRRYVRRLIPEPNLRAADGSEGGYRLRRRRRRPPAEIVYEEMLHAQPGPGEVHLQLSALGVNYKDFATIAGLLDENPAVETGRIGLEGSGVVVAVGEGVTDVAKGDEVFGRIDGAGFPAVARPEFLRPKPPELSHAAAATLHVVMLSAWHGLHRLARLSAGETVLIHSAASALGLGAIQIAQHLGARVLATAGSKEKRSYLEGLGVEVIGSSRSPEFSEPALQTTDGKGVDVIFSALPAALIPANLAALRPATGRLIDVANIISDEKFSLQAMGRGVTIAGFDLDQIAGANSEYFAELKAEVGALIATGQLRPIPYRQIPATRAIDIIRATRRSTHIGKNVIDLTDGKVPMLAGAARLQLDPAASYLVTGGLGGLGLALAQRLAGDGARHLVLVGRRGANTPESGPVLHDLRAAGVQVEALACDVADAGQVEHLVARFGDDWPPLRGVIHSAGLSHDLPVRDMTREALHAVMAPKALGAWNLHLATTGATDVALDFFVCISSLANTIGNLGQANYAAANEFLDALVHYRRARGLPGITLALGVIADVGFVARDEATRTNTRRRGLGELGSDKVWTEICRALRDGVVHRIVADADWSRLGQMLRQLRRAPRFAPIMGKQDQHAPQGTTGTAATVVSGNTAQERRAWLEQVVLREVATVLGMTVDKVDPTGPLGNQGFDSLIAAELIVALERAVGIKPRQGVLLRPDLSVSLLADELAAALVHATDSESGPPWDDDTVSTQHAAAVSVSIDDLSDDEVDAMLRELGSDEVLNG